MRLTLGAEFLSRIGAIFLLFTVGLETRPSDLLKVGGTAVLVATLIAPPFLELILPPLRAVLAGWRPRKAVFPL